MSDLAALAAGYLTTDTLLLALAAFAAGLVRGFSGFGAAMIFVPLASVIVDPRTAVIALWVMDNLVTLPLVVQGMRNCTWSEIRPLFLGAIFGAPAGVWLLANAPEAPMRWAIAVLVLIAVAALASGYRRKKPLHGGGVVAVGAASGIGSGLAGLSGPPVIVFWVGGTTAPAQVRMNTFAFFGLTGAVAGVAHLVAGLFTPERIVLALMIAPAFAIAIYTGSALFGFASETLFRRFALSLCALAAIFVMPIWG